MPGAAYLIGIDPGTHTGVAVFNVEAQTFEQLVELDFWRTVQQVWKQYNPASVQQVIIEDATQISAIYHRNQREAGAARDMMAQRVGGVKRETELLIQGFEMRGYDVVRVKPQKRSKWSDKQFRQITGYTGRGVGEHVRDAARLVWERRWVQAALPI